MDTKLIALLENATPRGSPALGGSVDIEAGLELPSDGAGVRGAAAGIAGGGVVVADKRRADAAMAEAAEESTIIDAKRS